MAEVLFLFSLTVIARFINLGGHLGASTYASVILEHVFGNILRYFEAFLAFWADFGVFWN